MNSGFIIFIILLIYYFSTGNTTDASKRKSFIVFGCILFILESGLRHISVGNDTIGYYAYYCIYRDDSWASAINNLFVGKEEWRDSGYPLFCKFISTFIPSWQLFLLTLSISFYYALGKLLYTYVEETIGILLAFGLCCCLFHIIALSGIRQQIVMTISMLVVPMFERHKWKWPVVLILLFSTIHISGLFTLLFIPFYIVNKNKYERIHLILILLIPVIALFANKIIGYMSSFIANDYYSQYTNEEVHDLPIVNVLLFSILSIFLYINRRKLLYAPDFFWAAAILMTFFVPLIVVNGAMIRMGQYFTIYLMLSIPYVIKDDTNKNMLYFIMISMLFINSMSSNIVYKFFWQSDPVLDYWYGY